MLDPQARTFLDRLAAFDGPKIEDLEAHEARALSDPFLKSLGGEGAPVSSVRDVELAGPRVQLHARIYTPSGSGPFGVLVYFHGGGYVYGSVDSAGGSLAAQVYLAARDRGELGLVFQLLIYPGVDFDLTRPSYLAYGDGYLLTKPKIEWFVRQYLARPEDADLPYVCPLRAASVANVPPALVIVAECDPLRDEGVAYARRLEAEGVPATFVQYDGQIHGFFSSLGVFSEARAAVAEAGTALRLAFGRRLQAQGAAPSCADRQIG